MMRVSGRTYADFASEVAELMCGAGPVALDAVRDDKELYGIWDILSYTKPY